MHYCSFPSNTSAYNTCISATCQRWKTIQASHTCIYFFSSTRVNWRGWRWGSRVPGWFRYLYACDSVPLYILQSKNRVFWGMWRGRDALSGHTPSSVNELWWLYWEIFVEANWHDILWISVRNIVTITANQRTVLPQNCRSSWWGMWTLLESMYTLASQVCYWIWTWWKFISDD